MGNALRPTRNENLAYRQDGPALWRFYDITDGRKDRLVGPQYKTKSELLADLSDYEVRAGWAK